MSAKPALAREYVKQLFPDRRERRPKTAIKTGPNVYGKPCRIVATPGRFSAESSGVLAYTPKTIKPICLRIRLGHQLLETLGDSLRRVSTVCKVIVVPP